MSFVSVNRWIGVDVPQDVQIENIGGTSALVEDWRKRLPEVKLPEESEIAAEEETKETKTLRAGSPFLSQIDDFIIAVLGTLSPKELKLAARACKTFYKLSKHRVSLEASLHKILPDVKLLDRCTFTFDQQFRMICNGIFFLLSVLNRQKKTVVDNLQSLASDRVIGLAWRQYVAMSESNQLPVHTYEEALKLQQQNLQQDPIDIRVQGAFRQYFELRKLMISMAGADYNGDESSIARNSTLGAIRARETDILALFNNQDYVEDLIRAKEQQANL